MATSEMPPGVAALKHLRDLAGLWAYQPPRDGAAGTFTHLRDLTDEERRSVDRALELFTSLTVDSPDIALQATYEEFLGTLNEFFSVTDTAAAFSAASELRRRFRHWLGDVLTFRDRSKTFASKLFGRQHAAVSTVESWLAAEESGNFAYRFVTQILRNESTHARDVLNDLRSNAFRDAIGEARHHNTAKIDCSQLGSNFIRDKARRGELEAVSRPFDLRLLVSRTMDSCLAIHAEWIRALRSELMPLLDTVQGLHAEVEATGAGWSVIGELRDSKAQGGRDFSSLQNPWQQARALSGWLEEFDDTFVAPLHVRATREQFEAQCLEVEYLELIAEGRRDAVPPDVLRRFEDQWVVQPPSGSLARPRVVRRDDSSNG